MLLAEVEWNQVILTAITTLGLILTAWIALRQRAIDAKVELAKLETAKQGQRLSRRTKRLTNETKHQTKMIADTQTHVKKLEEHTNGMHAKAVEAAHREGKAEGAAEALEKNIPTVEIKLPESGEVELIDTSTGSKVVIPPQGAKGEQGDKGDKGDTGDRGERGPRGENGERG